MMDKLDEAFKKWQAHTNELVKLFDEEIAKTARNYHHSKAKELDDRILQKLARIAEEMDNHVKNGTKPVTTDLVKWANFLWRPKKY